MDDKEYVANAQFLRSSAEFTSLPPRFQELVLKSPNASADYKDFFAHGGRIVPDPNESLAVYRAEPNREIRVNQSQYEFAKTREGVHLVGDMFSRMAHEVGHDKDRNISFPPAGVPDTAEAYVQFRSEKEAKAIFNTFPIFADLEKNEPSFARSERKWAAVGYSVMGLDWPGVYGQWKNGELDDKATVKEIAKAVGDYPYTRTDGLTDQNQDGKLTQRDLYLRDYQGLLRHQREPSTSPQKQSLNDMREPTHPGHRGYGEILHRVGMFEAQNRIESSPYSERLAASIAVLAAQEKLDPSRIFIEKNEKGQIEIVQRPRYGEPDSNERRIGINAGDMASRPIERSSLELAQAFSQHYGSNAPAAGRTREQTQALGQMSPNDQAIFDRIRQDVPSHISDDKVAQATLAAKQGYIARPDMIESVVVGGDKLFISGTIQSGLGRAVLNLAESAPPMLDTVQQTQVFNQEREQQLAMQAMQRGLDDPSRGVPRTM